jgi:hypothetical protein
MRFGSENCGKECEKQSKIDSEMEISVWKTEKGF